MHSLEEIIEDFLKNQNWVSVPIDNRSITIKNYTYSTTTNFSWKLAKGKDENKQRWRNSVGRRVESLLSEQPISNCLLTLQVWKAGEFFFFRIKPLPGTAIIDVLGQMRTDLNC